jgi:hypothetical protein
MDRFRNPIYRLGGGVSEFSPVLQPTYRMNLYLHEDNHPLAILGPEALWAGEAEKNFYASFIGPNINNPNVRYESNVEYNETVRSEAALNYRKYATSIDDMVTQITNFSGLTYYGVGIWKPIKEPPVFFYQKADYLYSAEQIGITFDLLTNMMARDSSSNRTARIIRTEVTPMASATVDHLVIKANQYYSVSLLPKPILGVFQLLFSLCWLSWQPHRLLSSILLTKNSTMFGLSIIAMALCQPHYG